MPRTVQFYGREAIKQAFNNVNADGWSIWQDRQMITKGVGLPMLESFFDLLGDSPAWYTLKVYDEIEDSKQIKDKTPADGSFTFVLSNNGIGSLSGIPGQNDII